VRLERSSAPSGGGPALAAVFVGGIVGTLARYGLLEWLPTGPDEWPWATFLANAIGAFLLGCFAARLDERTPLRPLLTTGLCGALTTFSTLQLELLRMLDHDALGLAAAYLSLSVVVGLLAVTLGMELVRRSARVAA
jgi:fluoride exporter